MFDAIIAVIWVVFMIIAGINAVIKKKKQQDQAQEESPAAASKPAYAAREEDIRTFLEEVGGRKPVTPQQPAQPPRRKKKARPAAPAPAKAATPSRHVWDDDEDASQIPVLSAENDPLAALTKHLSPIQRAIIWREVLDTPPGLRTGSFARE